MAQERLRWGSFVLLMLAAASWVMVLGGLGAVNWMACTDTQTTRTSIATTQGNSFKSVAPYAQFSVPAVDTNVAVCARSWRWEWWTLFFQFVIISYGLVATLMPQRLARARYAVAQLLVIATVLIMVALNDDISDVWFFWDQKKMFAQWDGVMKKLYMSAAAVVAGWILMAIFNLVWIGFSLDYEVDEKKEAAAPATDVEAPQAPKK